MNKNLKKTVWGIAFILIAVLVILSVCKVGIFAGLFAGLNWFQILVAAFCVVLFLDGISEFGIIRIFVSLGILYAIFQENLALTNIPTSGIVAAVILVAMGLKLLLPKTGKFQFSFTSDKNKTYIKNGMRYYSREDFDNEVNGTPLNSVSEDGNDVEVNFGSTVKYYNVDNFSHANLECNFGSIKAFFDNAQMEGNFAVIEAESNFGSIELFIPKAWNVDIKKESFAGSVEEKGRVEYDGAHTVRVNADVNFGSLTIHHV